MVLLEIRYKNTSPPHPIGMPVAFLHLPISVYRFDSRTKQYLFQSCMQCVVRGAPMPTVLTSSAGQGMMGENLDFLKAVMRAPAIVLCKGARIRKYNTSLEEVVKYLFNIFKIQF